MPKSTYSANATLTARLGGTKYFALHTADPGVGGTQSTSAATYTGYAQATGSFTVSGAGATLNAAVNFPICTAGSSTVTYVSVGDSTNIDYYGAVTSTTIAVGQTPSLTAATVSES
jgi:hypothetical protein